MDSISWNWSRVFERHIYIQTQRHKYKRYVYVRIYFICTNRWLLLFSLFSPQRVLIRHKSSESMHFIIVLCASFFLPYYSVNWWNKLARIEVEKYTGIPTITLSKEMLLTPFLKVTLLSRKKILLLWTPCADPKNKKV